MRSFVSVIIGIAFVCACHSGGSETTRSPSRSQARADSSARDRAEVAPDQAVPNCAGVKTWSVGFPGTPPVVVTRVEPVIDGSLASVPRAVVTVETVIDRTGSVCEARVVQSLSPSIDGAVVAAVKEWRFTPAMLNGEPQQVAYNVSIPIGR